jgi:hypothetical protein
MKLVLNSFLKLKFKNLFIFLFVPVILGSQINIYQDIWKGGLKHVSYSVGQGEGQTILDLSIPTTSTLKKIYLITYGAVTPPHSGVFIENIEIDTLQYITRQNHLLDFFTPIDIYYSDLTFFFQNNITDFANINVEIIKTCPEIINCGFSTATFIILYEDLTLPEVNLSLIIPNQNLFGQESYSISNINPINSNLPVAFSIVMDRSCTPIQDGTKVTINNNYLGTIGGEDLGNNPACSGSQGQFYYENQTLTALSDDNINLDFQNTDALGDISSIVNNLSTNLSVYLEHVNLQGSPANRNVYIAFPMAYSTPCNAFQFTIPNDSTICKNETIQLNATGGIKYEWLPQQGLSCYDCPNPIFEGDSSRVYTLQIWNTDSCSVVRPISLKVREVPKLDAFSITKPDCGTNNGVLQIVTNSDSLVSYQLDGGSLQSTTLFENLSKGNHTLFFTDKFGCTGDSIFSIQDTISTNAFFTATPSYGFIPLEIDFSNLSTNATNYIWTINDEVNLSELLNYNFTTSGYYDIELFAWQYDESCKDSFTLKITAFDYFIYQIPNIFTPNHDATNDVFGIISNLPLEINYEIYNRWGNLMHSGTSRTSDPNSIIIDLGNGQSFYQLWDGTALASSASATSVNAGVYFYKLELNVIKELLLPSIDLGQQKLEFPLKKEGWVQLVRD